MLPRKNRYHMHEPRRAAKIYIHDQNPIMNKVYTILFAALLSVSSSVFAEDGWTEMFNGKDLTNWKLSEESPTSFQVKDGILIVAGPRSHLFYQEQGADAKLQNFEFEAVIKTHASANSGIFFHTLWQKNSWPVHGYEAQVNSSHKDPRKTGSVYSVKDVMNNAPHKDDEWFTYNIRVEGKRIIIKVNGEVVNDYTEPENPGHATRRLSAGTIAIQAHDPQSVIHYKSLRLRKLP